jgi:hypothetical protein
MFGTAVLAAEGDACQHDYDYTKGTVTKASTATEGGTVEYTCKICKETKTETLAANPFTDVTDTEQFYYVPVLWATDKGYIKGTSSDTYTPSGKATRAEVVTILWRAAGEPEPTSATNPFTDVVDTEYTNWYYKAVLWAVEKGIIKGITATTFEPNTVCNRATLLTMVYRYEGEPSASAENPFEDVVKTEYTTWYYDAVLWAVENGVTTGTDATHFSPYENCARSEMATFIYRALRNSKG